MKYPVCGIAVYLTCHALLFASGTSAEQGNGASGAVVGGQSVRYHPRCTEKNPAPNCLPVPRVVSSPAPTYSEEARKAKIEGSVVLGLIVDERGNVTNLRVISSLGMGLDEKAIEAVRNWKFERQLSKTGNQSQQSCLWK